jgi:hypothetical protein
MKLITKLLDSSKLEPFKTAWHGLWSTCTFVINQKKIIILKLDFEKAFDRIEHTTTLQLMKVKGFGNIWLKWMQQFLSLAPLLFCLMAFHCKRGVRQGDPLSPLLFVLAADFLQTLINKAKEQGQLRLPIPCKSDRFFLVVQYADDTLIIMEGCTNQLLILKDILNVFSQATGLKVNYNKSMMVQLMFLKTNWTSWLQHSIAQKCPYP